MTTTIKPKALNLVFVDGLLKKRDDTNKYYLDEQDIPDYCMISIKILDEQNGLIQKINQIFMKNNRYKLCCQNSRDVVLHYINTFYKPHYYWGQSSAIACPSVIMSYYRDVNVNEELTRKYNFKLLTNPNNEAGWKIWLADQRTLLTKCANHTKQKDKQSNIITTDPTYL